MGIEMRTNSVTRQYIAPNGNIRIGDASTVPSYKLEVDGTLNVKGDIYKNGVLFAGGAGNVNYKNLIVNDETRTSTTTTTTTIQEPTYTASSYITKTTIDNDYKYIMFKNNGNNQTSYSITFPENTECDILVIGGGGAGGNSMGGGGGAGGVVYTVNQTLSGSYVISVGKGGDGISLAQDYGTGQGTIGVEQDGFESSILNTSGNYISLNMGGTNQDLRAFGGGGGGVYFDADTIPGRPGGSGGGSAERENAVYNGGTSLQPNTLWNGTSYVKGGSDGNGNLTTDGNYFAAGGGGAGATLFNNIYNGKKGIQNNITGTNNYYAGGGGGGQYHQNDTSRGLGADNIGGNGRIFTSGNEYVRDATSGLDGTGSGGGGNAFSQDPDNPAGNGGSGIVIIRYKYSTTSTTTGTETYTPTGHLTYNINPLGNYEWKFGTDAIMNEMSYQYKMYVMMYELNKVFVNYEYSVNNGNYYPMFAFDTIYETDNLYKISVGTSNNVKIRIGKSSLHYVDIMRPKSQVNYTNMKIQIRYYNSSKTYLGTMDEVSYSGTILETISLNTLTIGNNVSQYGNINNVVLIEIKLTNGSIDFDTQWFLVTTSGGIN